MPTLHCANFLIELISGDAEVQEEILCSLETGNHNLGDLKEVVKKYHKLFSRVSPLVGDSEVNGLYLAFTWKHSLISMELIAYKKELMHQLMNQTSLII